MTNQEIIEKFKSDKVKASLDIAGGVFVQTDLAHEIVKALEQEPILDKIIKEIIEEKDFAYADFERYKVECLGQDWEDAYDSLPQDDFRFGMERAIEIICKYKGRK